MTAELWLVKPCPHGGKQGHHSYPTCDGESRVRLDPDEVVFKPWAVDAMAKAREQITVKDVTDALEEE
jgi:hypothetical protein